MENEFILKSEAERAYKYFKSFPGYALCNFLDVAPGNHRIPTSNIFVSLGQGPEIAITSLSLRNVTHTCPHHLLLNLSGVVPTMKTVDQATRALAIIPPLATNWSVEDVYTSPISIPLLRSSGPMNYTEHYRNTLCQQTDIYNSARRPIEIMIARTPFATMCITVGREMYEEAENGTIPMDKAVVDLSLALLDQYYANGPTVVEKMELTLLPFPPPDSEVHFDFRADLHFFYVNVKERIADSPAPFCQTISPTPSATHVFGTLATDVVEFFLKDKDRDPALDKSQ